MQSYEDGASRLSSDPVQALMECPFCGGYWEVMPIPQTYRYSAIGICSDCGAMVMTTGEHPTLAGAMNELIHRINKRNNSNHCCD